MELSKIGVINITTKNCEVNSDIKDNAVRLIGADGEQLGVMSAHSAQEKADEIGLDLVKVSPSADPPVCKLMDYGKFKFEQTKREKEARKKQHVVETKEIRMYPSIGDHDFDVKLRSAQKFLKDGCRVKVTVHFRGREMAHTELGKELLLRFTGQCAEMANVDKAPMMEGRSMVAVLMPR